MGTFEKLGILVIVVIIVMILAVAIYQWGGAGTPAVATTIGEPGNALTVKTIDDLVQEDAGAAAKPPVDDAGTADADMWPGRIPKRYQIAKDDKVWVIVVKRWGLKETFIQEIENANPRIDFKRLHPGEDLVIPDPSAYRRTAAEKQAPPAPKAGSTRRYEVQGGDTLESIAYRHLGSKTRWPEIVALNPGLDPKRLFEGQEIYLPLK
jgi:nucleoid-associated protein YgaU